MSNNDTSYPVNPEINNPATISAQDRIFAGIGGAVVAFPLSIGFALIAGIPEEIMIQASIYAALINALFSSSRYGISGPNTAVALITGGAIAPFAPREGDAYMGYIFALCVLVAVIQLCLSLLLRKIDIMDYVSNTVIDGLTFGIGIIFILNSINMAAGLSPDITNQWMVLNVFTSIVLIMEGDANYYALLVSVVTIIIGVLSWRLERLRRFAIPIAITAGYFTGNMLGIMVDSRLDQVGWLDLQLFTTTMPDFRPVSWPILVELIGPAFAIALIGTLQTLSIAKSLRDPGAEYNPAKETFSQGFQHLFMAFYQGCPVSSSYNKSSLQRDLKGDKWSFVIAALFTLFFVENLGAVVAAIPMPALAGCMILVGLSMMSFNKHQRYFANVKPQLAVFMLSASIVVILSIPAAIFFGALLSISLHFAKFSHPDISIMRNHDNIITVTIKGVLFFVSAAKINKYLQTELNRADYSNATQVFIDLRQAQIMTDDQIDVDWIHKIVSRKLPVTIVCSPEQTITLDTLQQRKELPKNCLLLPMEAGEDKISVQQSRVRQLQLLSCDKNIQVSTENNHT